MYSNHIYLTCISDHNVGTTDYLEEVHIKEIVYDTLTTSKKKHLKKNICSLC